MHDINKLNRNTWLGLAAVLLWSATIALARRISEQLGPLTAGSAVYLLAGLLFAVHRFGKDQSWKQILRLPRRYVFGCGALFVIYAAALFFALGLAANRSQTLEIGLLNYLWPMPWDCLRPLPGHSIQISAVAGGQAMAAGQCEFILSPLKSLHEQRNAAFPTK